MSFRGGFQADYKTYLGTLSEIPYLEGAMSAEKGIEERLLALESAVAGLQFRLSRTAGPDWIDKITGSITDDEAFREALEYGRAFRHADRPEDEPGQQP